MSRHKSQRTETTAGEPLEGMSRAAPQLTRQPRVLIVAGRNGAGKTTLAKHLVSRHRDAFIIAPSREWGEWGDPEELAKKAISRGCDALVLDDADSYLPTNPNPFWTKTLIINRHLGIDILLLSRRPQALPLYSVSAATHAYLLPLGPRERRWCEKALGALPPETGFNPVVVTL